MNGPDWVIIAVWLFIAVAVIAFAVWLYAEDRREQRIIDEARARLYEAEDRAIKRLEIKG